MNPSDLPPEVLSVLARAAESTVGNAPLLVAFAIWLRAELRSLRTAIRHQRKRTAHHGARLRALEGRPAHAPGRPHPAR